MSKEENQRLYDWNETKTQRASQIETELSKFKACVGEPTKRQQIAKRLGELQQNYRQITGSFYCPHVSHTNEFYENCSDE